MSTAMATILTNTTTSSVLIHTTRMLTTEALIKIHMTTGETDTPPTFTMIDGIRIKGIIIGLVMGDENERYMLH